METLKNSAQQGYELFIQLKNEHKLEVREFSPGDFIITQGQELRELYWIESGQFTVGHSARNGRFLSLGRYPAHNHLIGEIELHTGTKCQFDVCASQKTKVTVIPITFITELMQNEPNISIWLCQSLSRHYQTTVEVTTNRILHPLIYNIAWDIEQRYLKNKPNINFTQGYKEAERFGCSERVYRRVVSELLSMGFVEKISNQLEVKDIDVLSEFLNN
jgi:CRP-like cAMP-binding protein